MNLSETITKTVLRDKSEMTIQYVERAQELKPGCRCDAIRGYINGKLVGYVKIDYTTVEMLRAECPTLWSFANHYAGFSGNTADIPYDEQTIEQLYSLLTAIKYSLRLRDANLPHDLTPRQRELFDLAGSLRSSSESLSDLDRQPLTVMLKKLERCKEAKLQYGTIRTRYLGHHSKPFVAYSNTEQSLYKRFDDDRITTENAGRGIASILYRATAEWIVERGLAAGLYASGNRSQSALSLWSVFEKRGWVTQDGDRMYLDPKKFPPLI